MPRVEILAGKVRDEPEGGSSTMGSVVAPLVSIVAGAVLGVTTLMGVISSQTGAPDQSPANAEAPALEYGTVSE
jgi:hypothetical protein